MSNTDTNGLKLAIEGKDRDYFMERGVAFPVYWYGFTDLPEKRKKSRAYSAEMRELAEYPIDYLEVVEMFWGLAPVVLNKIKKIPREFVENIPVPTPTRINALVQTKLSMIMSDERKEWADRIEGKTVSREVSMSLVTEDDGITETRATKELITSKFDELAEVWKGYSSMSEKPEKLDYQETLKLESKEDTDGELQG